MFFNKKFIRIAYEEFLNSKITQFFHRFDALLSIAPRNPISLRLCGCILKNLKLKNMYKLTLSVFSLFFIHFFSSLYIHFSASDFYLLNPSSFGFTDQDCPVFSSNGSFLGIGMRKGIRTVENASSENQMSEAIVASVKKVYLIGFIFTVFYFFEDTFSLRANGFRET